MTGALSRRAWRGISAARFLPSYIGLAIAKRFVPMETLCSRQWRSTRVRSQDRERRVVADIVRLSQRLGFADRDCLQRSLLIYREVSRSGSDPTLVVGVCREEGRVLGHAWVMVNNAPVADDSDHVARFEPLFSFGRNGALLRATARPPRQSTTRRLEASDI